MSQFLLNNRYQILSKLATGGFGETFLAIDTHLPSGKKCVIKQLKPPVDSGDLPTWLKERFEKEAIILEELGSNSSQIPRLYAYFSEKDNFYLVQEWIEGLTLTQMLKQKGIFSEEEVEDLLSDILPVLIYVHSRGIIHRDIKPDNIIIRKSDKKPVLIDFGIIKEKVATQIRGANNSSVILGTPGYMSSEQAAGRPVYSSDLYSLALTAVFLLTGKNAEDFAADNNTGEILWRSSLKNQHSQLVTILEKAIRFHPKDRFVSAQEMLAALRKIPQQSATKVIINPTKQKFTQSYQESNDNSENGVPSWLIMFFVSIVAFGVGFVLVKNNTLLFNEQNTVSPSSSVTISSTPIPSLSSLTPSLEPSASITPSPSLTSNNDPSSTPTPSDSDTPIQAPSTPKHKAQLSPSPEPSTSSPEPSTSSPEPSTSSQQSP